MPEFVTLKVKVSFSAETVGQQTDHFVEGHATIDCWRQGGEGRHVGVHLGITKMHHQGFVANKPKMVRLAGEREGGEDLRLVVTLAVCNRPFAMSSVREGKADVANIPVLVLLLLENLDPHIWNCHGKTIVKANTTKGKRKTESRHARDIFSNSDNFWVKRVEHLVGNHKVDDGLLISVGAKVLVVTPRKSTVLVSALTLRKGSECFKVLTCQHHGVDTACWSLHQNGNHQSGTHPSKILSY